MPFLRQPARLLHRLMSPVSKKRLCCRTSRPLHLEILEDRTVPATYTMRGTNLHDRFYVTEYSSTQAAVYRSTYLDDNYTMPYGQTSWFNFPMGGTLVLEGYLGNDLLSAYGSALCSIVYQGDGGTDSANYYGRYLNEGITVTGSSVYGPVNLNYQGIENLIVDSGDGNDTMYVLSTSVPTTIQSSWGRETVKLGDVSSVQGIQAPLTIKNNPDYSLLNIDNSRDTGNREVIITPQGITGLAPAPINYVQGDLSALVISGGSSWNRYSVQGTPESSITGGLITTLRGGPNMDYLNIEYTSGAFNAYLGAGDDYAFVSAAYSEGIYYGFMMDFLKKPITINGEAGLNILYLYDNESFYGQSYTYSPTQLLRSGNVQINYYNFNHAFLFTSEYDDSILITGSSGTPRFLDARDGNDDIVLSSLSSSAHVNLYGGDGLDTLTGPNAYATWKIQQFPEIALSDNPNARAYWSSMERLQGGSSGDAFSFADGYTFEGAIDGGGGLNSLKYDAYTTDVYVNFRAGVATGVGSFWNITDAAGGAGNDILVGSGGNSLVGGAGNDLLIAGSALSFLAGMEGDDLLIAGFTVYDEDEASLVAIRDAWAAAEDYATRTNHLLTGNGVPLLDSSTIFSNGGSNILIGGSEADLFFCFYDVDNPLDLEDGEQVIWM